MKNLLFFLLIVFILTGCDKESGTTDIIGEWELIEVLADPGDGSGQFRPVSSDKRIRFFEDGTYTSTGSICDFSIESEGDSTGTYLLSDSGYRISCSEAPEFTIGLRIEDGYLIVTFPCIEPCLHKFRKSN